MEKEIDKKLEIQFTKDDDKQKGFLSSFKQLFLKLFTNNLQSYSNNQNETKKDPFNLEEEKSSIEIQIQKETALHFDSYLENNSYLLCLDLINNGYKLTPKQEKKYINGVYTENIKDSSFLMKFYDKSVDKNIDILLIYDWILHHSQKVSLHSISTILNDNKFKYSIFDAISENLEKYTKHVLGKIKISCTTLGIINEYGEPLSNVVYMEKFNNLIKFNQNIIESSNNGLNAEQLKKYKISLQNSATLFTSFCDKINSYAEHYKEDNKRFLCVPEILKNIDKIEGFIEKLFSSEHDKIVKKLANINTVNTIDTIETKINNDIKVRIINIKKELPEDAKEKLELINNKYKKIKTYYKENSLLDMSIIEIDTLYEKNTVDIVTKYLSTDESFRETFVDKNNKTVKDIMLDAFVEINAVLDKKLLEINISKMKDMNASYQVVKAKNN